MNLAKTQEPRAWVVYTLSDPRTPDAVRYVGVTHRSVASRLKSHFYLARKGLHTHTSYWIQSLLEIGIVPVANVIDNGSGPDWGMSEKKWIAWYREHGFDLTNHTSGGDGSLGRSCSPETRAKLRASKLGKKLSPEHRAKISEAGRGRTASPETRAKLSASKLNNNPSAETRAKISAAHLGTKRSPEARAKMSAARQGRKYSSETCAKLSESIRRSWESRDRSFSPETRAKMSEAQKVRWAKIRQKSLENSDE